MANTAQAQNVVAVSGSTFPVKDQLKKLGFRFRRADKLCGNNDPLDAGLRDDTPFWFLRADDADVVLAQLANFDDLLIRVDGRLVRDDHMDFTGLDVAGAGRAMDTDDHMWDGADAPIA